MITSATHVNNCLLMWETLKLCQNGINDNDSSGRRRPPSSRNYARRRTGNKKNSLDITLHVLSHWFSIHKCNVRLKSMFVFIILMVYLYFIVNMICYGGSQSGCNILEYQNQAKMLFRKLGPQSPIRCSIETGPYLFQWVLTLVIYNFFVLHLVSVLSTSTKVPNHNKHEYR